MFEAGQIVWAKIKGYPWWPAMISQVYSSEPFEQDKSGANCEYLVNFIGENSHATLPFKKLVEFEKHYKEYSNQNRNKKLIESIGVACKILNGETSFESESRRLEFLFINQKEKKISKKSKSESRTEEDFDFVSNISNKSKSSNNYFKREPKEIYPDQSFKKVKTISFNNSETSGNPKPEHSKLKGNSPKKPRSMPKEFNNQVFAKILNETRDSLINDKDPDVYLDMLVLTGKKLKEQSNTGIQNFMQKHGQLLDAIILYSKKFYGKNLEFHSKIENLEVLQDSVKVQLYNEYFDADPLISNIKSEFPKLQTPDEPKKEIATFDYNKETSCETKEHSNYAFSEKSDLSSNKSDINELRKRIRMKLEKLLEKKFDLEKSLAITSSSEIEHKVHANCQGQIQSYAKASLILFRSIKKDFISFSTLQRTKDFNTSSLELKLALSENTSNPSKELKENSLGVIK